MSKCLMTISKWALVVLTSVAFATPVLAQEAGGEGTVDVGGVQYKKKTVYDFDDDIVEGDLARPDQEFVGVRRQAKHSSLIKIREHFIPEMLKSADDV